MKNSSDKTQNQYPGLVFLSILILLFSTISCSLPFKIVWTGTGAENEKTAQADAAIAELLITKEPETEADADDELDLSSSTAENIASETPSLTPSPQATETPEPATLTAEITKNTNCRIGPKDVFELIHIFVAGDKVDLLGKNEEDSFWFVKDQEENGYDCWIWNEYATTSGDTDLLPVFTPPPEPAPIMNFVVSYKATTGETVITVYVRNTGNVALQSYSATFKDTQTSELLAVSGNKFGNAAKVSVGNTGVVSSPSFSASTIGHQINVSVKACSLDGLSGKCYTVSTSFESK
jgi:hypothetical protein